MNTLFVCKRTFVQSFKCESDFSHIVVGGGVVGTAIASLLQAVSTNNVALLDQHEMLGMETTSRNSEVVHAGLYYPPETLKAQLCIRGKDLIYRLDRSLVPYQRCGKWVVAQCENEAEYLQKLSDNARELAVPTRLISRKEAYKLHPMIKAEYGALESPTTGIISAHNLVTFCAVKFEKAGGTIGLHTKIIDIEYQKSMLTYVVHCIEEGSKEQFTLGADNIINSAGLHAASIANMLLPDKRKFSSYFAKGNYFNFAPSEPLPISKVTSKLIYPCPKANVSGLGTHLTFDLGGQVRFGPDLEWLSEVDASKLNYDISIQNLDAAVQAINSYFPAVKIKDLQPSYSGIRPKLLSQQESKERFADFYIKEEEGFKGFVNLIGIESPGLTSSLAIAEYVKNIYHD